MMQLIGVEGNLLPQIHAGVANVRQTFLYRYVFDLRIQNLFFGSSEEALFQFEGKSRDF
jgi:hypothetical protein